MIVSSLSAQCLQRPAGGSLALAVLNWGGATLISLTDHQSVHEPAPPNLWTIKWRIYASKAYLCSGQEYEHSCRTKSGEHGGNGAVGFDLIIRNPSLCHVSNMLALTPRPTPRWVRYGETALERAIPSLRARPEKFL